MPPRTGLPLEGEIAGLPAAAAAATAGPATLGLSGAAFAGIVADGGNKLGGDLMPPTRDAPMDSGTGDTARSAADARFAGEAASKGDLCAGPVSENAGASGLAAADTADPPAAPLAMARSAGERPCSGGLPILRAPAGIDSGGGGSDASSSDTSGVTSAPVGRVADTGLAASARALIAAVA